MSLVKSVFKVFDGKQKRKLFGMAFLILINSGVSLLGVSVLLPFIQAVTAPEELLANRYVAAFYEWMGMENPNELITAIAIGIVIVYLAKNAFITTTINPHSFKEVTVSLGITGNSIVISIEPYVIGEYLAHVTNHFLDGKGNVKIDVSNANSTVTGTLYIGAWIRYIKL